MVALKQGRQAAGLASWGLGTSRNDWWHEAACRTTPELHTAEYRAGWHEHNSPQAHARHICLRHCPVFTQCHAEALRARPSFGVQAGQVWVTTSADHGKPAAKQPPDIVCGLWCIDLPGAM